MKTKIYTRKSFWCSWALHNYAYVYNFIHMNCNWNNTAFFVWFAFILHWFLFVFSSFFWLKNKRHKAINYFIAFFCFCRRFVYINGVNGVFKRMHNLALVVFGLLFFFFSLSAMIHLNFWKYYFSFKWLCKLVYEVKNISTIKSYAI